MSIILKKITICIKIVLGISFLGLLFYSINKLVERRVGNKTYIDTSSPIYPTITICPCPYSKEVTNTIHPQMNFTIEDIMKLPSMKDHIQATMIISTTYAPLSE